jgi:hypothetical protein
MRVNGVYKKLEIGNAKGAWWAEVESASMLFKTYTNLWGG